MKKAIITGIIGQDGAYLTKLLLEKRYENSRVRALLLIKYLLKYTSKEF